MGGLAARIRTLAMPGMLALLGAAAGCAPVADPSAGLSVADAVALIEKTPRSELTPEAVADAFALNTRTTDVQREMLETSLVGHTVEWQLRVYEVSFEGGRYKVTSQAIPIAEADAVPLLRVVAFLLPQSETDDALLRTVKTDDVIRIRGIVQEIQLRTIVVVVPGVVTSGSERSL